MQGLLVEMLHVISLNSSPSNNLGSNIYLCSLTQHESHCEEELVVLVGEGGEEAAEGGDEAAHDGRQPRRPAPAHRHRHRRRQQRHARAQRAQPHWKVEWKYKEAL